MRYSEITGCFYPEWGAYGNALPSDVATVPDEDFEIAMKRPANSKIKLVNGRIKIEEVVTPLETVKAQMWEQIKAERDSRITGGVLVSGNWFHSDGYSRIQHLGLKDEVKDTNGGDADHVVIDGEPIMWKTMAGTFVPLTRKLVLDIVKAVKVLDKRLFKAAEVHRATMEASADPSAYDFSTGWPARYGDAV